MKAGMRSQSSAGILAGALFWLSLLPLGACAADSLGAAPAATPVLTTLPSWQFASTVVADDLYDALKATPTFAALDKEKLGSPVAVRVSHMFGHTSKGTASEIASALLAGGTLGLLPAFSNRDLTLRYEILVNGSVLLSYQYSKNLTRVFNLHSTDKTHGLGAEGVAWVTGTAGQFAADVRAIRNLPSCRRSTATTTRPPHPIRRTNS
jgi:hypothetical protein